MTVKITNTMGSNIITNNAIPSAVIKAYQDPIKIIDKVVTESSPKPEDAVTFERQDKPLFDSEKTPEDTTPPPTTTPPTTEVKPSSEERRDAMKRANQEHQKAIKLQQEATELMKKNQAYQEALQKADLSPMELIKALGKDPADFLRRLQNEQFSIPNEPTKIPEPTVEDRLKQYEQERQKEREQAANYQSEMIKMNYISNKIIPAISNEEQFPLLVKNKDASAKLIYDIMNSHYLQFNEELNPADVAAEYESELEKEVLSSIDKIKQISKFKGHFKEEQPAIEAPATQLGEKPQQAWQGAKSPVPVATGQRTSSLDRSARKKRIMAM